MPKRNRARQARRGQIMRIRASIDPSDARTRADLRDGPRPGAPLISIRRDDLAAVAGGQGPPDTRPVDGALDEADAAVAKQDVGPAGVEAGRAIEGRVV